MSTTVTSDEEAKRLTITKDTLRELYLLSGNRCEFPNCPRPILDPKGKLRAEICHIEAAMPGGERFNAKMTNEDRRQVSNLMLMCHDHHQDTDDVVAYPVERLQSMKREHEDRFRSGWQELMDEVKDWTQGTVVTKPTNMDSFLSFTGLPPNLTESELEETKDTVLHLADGLRTLTLPARQTLHIIVSRGTSSEWGEGNFKVLPSELEDATGQQSQRVVDRVLQLNTAGYAYYDEDFDGCQWVYTRLPEGTDWPTWAELKDFCADTDRLRALIVDLRFDLLD